MTDVNPESGLDSRVAEVLEKAARGEELTDEEQDLIPDDLEGAEEVESED